MEPEEQNLNVCPVCKKSADKMCSACRSVSYCSPEHQKQHWKQHKHTCRVWTIKTNDIMGRYIVAARDIAPGTVILDEEALVIGPKQNSVPICLGCHKPVNGIYFCSQCFFPMCNSDCEKQSIHANNECLVFRKKRAFPKVIDYSQHHPVYECITAIRSIRLKELNPNKWAKLNMMEHHNDLRKKREGLWNRNERNVVQFLRDVFQYDVDPTTIHTVLGYGDINAFEINCKSKVSICGIFPDVSLMAHECVSNTHHSVTDDFRMVIRNTIPIKKGEMITTTYTHTLDGTLERRLHIQESKLFDCYCNRCKDPTELGTFFSAIKCKKCTNGYMLPIDSLSYDPVWGCNSCDFSVPNNTVEILVGSIKDDIHEAEKVQSVIELLEGILQQHCGKTLGPNHYLIVYVLHTLSQFYGKIKGWTMSDLSIDALRRKEEICRKLLEILDVIEPGLSRIRGTKFLPLFMNLTGMTIYELQQAIYYRVEKEFNDGLISAAELKQSLEQVLELLNIAFKILSFDSPSSTTGKLVLGIPNNITVVKTILSKVCDGDVK